MMNKSYDCSIFHSLSKKLKSIHEIREDTISSMSVPDFGPAGPSVVVYQAPLAPSSKQLYFSRNKEAFEAEKKENDDVLEDPITLEEMPEYVSGKTISYLRLTDKNVPVGMRFFTLGALEQCLAKNNKDPFTNQPWKSAMRRRVEIAVKAHVHAPRELDLSEIPSLFKEFIEDPEAFKLNKPAEYDLMHQDLHMGDAGILSSWGAINDDSLRSRAIATLENSKEGSWLIRNASVKSTNLITIQAISYVVSAKIQPKTNAPIIPAKIRHFLIMHARGFGYAIVEANSGQQMPDLTTKDISLPNHDYVYGSFLDVVEWLHKSACNFKLSNMIVNE